MPHRIFVLSSGRCSFCHKDSLFVPQGGGGGSSFHTESLDFLEAGIAFPKQNPCAFFEEV